MKKTDLKVDENIACFLCYILGWISGLVVLLIEKKNAMVRFHAMQSIIVFGSLSILGIVLSFQPFFGLPLMSLVHLAAVVLWVILMVKAYRGENFPLPLIEELAKDWSKKFKL